MAIRPARSTVSVALSLALAAFASSCGSGQEKPAASMPAATPTPAPAPRQGAPQAAAVPEAAPPEARPMSDYPGDFPGDVPRYPGSKVTSASGSAKEGFAVQISAPDSVEVVAKFFGDGLTASGWQAVVLQVMPDGTMITAEKDGALAQALVHEGGQGALVELIVGRSE